MKEKYYLKGQWSDKWDEVTREEYIRAERAAGFHPKSRNTDELATSSFGGGGIQGNVEYEEE